MKPVQGLHHITAVAGNPQANVDFYHHVLGQRMVKKTVKISMIRGLTTFIMEMR